MTTLGQRIKAARKKKGITQQELASRIGKALSTVQKYEIDVIQPSITTLNKIADALEVPLYTIYADTLTPRGITKEKPKAKSDLGFLTALFSADPEHDDIIEAYDQLNEEGKRKVVDYALDLEPKYPKDKE